MSLCPHGVRIEHRRCDQCEEIAEAEMRVHERQPCAQAAAIVAVDPKVVKIVASAIANARGGRRGAPAIVNVLDVLPDRLREEVMDDARAVVEALIEEKVGFR